MLVSWPAASYGLKVAHHNTPLPSLKGREGVVTYSLAYIAGLSIAEIYVRMEGYVFKSFHHKHTHTHAEGIVTHPQYLHIFTHSIV